MKMLFNLLWYYPAIAMTWWTVIVALVAWLMPLNRKVPFFAGTHGMLMMLNPKDEMLYQRPSALMVLGFLVLGLVPIVNAALLLFHVFIMAVALNEYAKQLKRKRLT